MSEEPFLENSKFEDTFQKYPEYLKVFTNAMNGHLKMIVNSFPKLDIWRKISKFIDVGGGNGFMA